MSFKLTLQIEHQCPLIVEDATIIDDKLVAQTWNMLGPFIEEALDDLGLEADGTRLRELVVELCYRLIFREMTTLLERPVKGRLATAKPKSRRARRKERQKEEGHD